MAQKPNLVERMIGWIPGYKGYADHETRRDIDRMVRDAVIRSLEPGRKAIDAAIAECSRSKALEHMEPLEALRRKLVAATDGLRHAPGGYSGFFDTVKIDAVQIDRITEQDLRLRDSASGLAAALKQLEAPSRDTIKAARSALDEFEAGLRRRADLLKGAE